MKSFLKDIYAELKFVLKGKTLDTLVPPILFAITLAIFSLEVALITSIGLSVIIFIFRVIKNDQKKYAFLGILGVLIAALFAYISKNASNYFIPGIIGSGLSVIGTLITLIIKKPLAAYVSHFTRGWPIEWFWRSDIKPAYFRVTVIWLIYFIFRTILETTVYLAGSVNQFVWINLLLGYPLIILVLTISYVYGIWKLKKLKGPGVDEYIEQKEPPYKGQTKGF